MWRYRTRSLALRPCRWKSSHVDAFRAQKFDFPTEQLDRSDAALPFSQRRHSESFGQLVRSEHWRKQGDLHDAKYVKKIELHEETGAPYDLSPFRNPDGSFIQGSNAEEARLHPDTLKARVDHLVTKLPAEIAKVINKNILSAVSPDKLRERLALVYQSLQKEQIQKAPDLSLDADAHIAALFLQNYSHAKRALLELKKRVPDFNPQSVLDIGYGPATGMIALNEIMGDDYLPRTKEVYVVGRANKEMKKRAKILLSRQPNEVPEDLRAEVEQAATESLDESDFDEDDYIGPVDASQIRVRTRLRDALPSTKQYELIIVNQALLSREYSFPKDVDTNLHMILRLLKPNGHLVIIERGNALGFEVVARARQVMLRPESHEGEAGKIPRPYLRGSTYKPQKLRREDQLITDDHVEYEKELLARMEAEDAAELGEEFDEVGDLEREINEKFGSVTEDELKFDFEDDDAYDVLAVDHAGTDTVADKVNYHLSVVAPCPHHNRCPLQLGDPKFYRVSNHKHRLNFCSFNQVVERPKYTMEVKKGRRLATEWDRGSQDGFGTDSLSKKTLKNLEGTGRLGSNNTESGNLSYLIMHRSPNDASTVAKIESDREHRYDAADATQHWPRVLDFPLKIKNNVKLNVCSASGNVEVWQIPKSMGKQTYHDARKVRQGDLWPLSKKSVVVKNRLSGDNFDKLKKLANTQRKLVLKEKRKKEWKKKVSHSASDFEDPLALHDELASDLETSKKYRTDGKRARFDVNPRDYDGR